MNTPDLHALLALANLIEDHDAGLFGSQRIERVAA